MSKRRNLIYFILLGFFLCAFSVGSFFDYQISEAMFSNKNTFGLVISVVTCMLIASIVFKTKGKLIVENINE